MRLKCQISKDHRNSSFLNLNNACVLLILPTGSLDLDMGFKVSFVDLYLKKFQYNLHISILPKLKYPPRLKIEKYNITLPNNESEFHVHSCSCYKRPFTGRSPIPSIFPPTLIPRPILAGALVKRRNEISLPFSSVVAILRCGHRLRHAKWLFAVVQSLFLPKEIFSVCPCYRQTLHAPSHFSDACLINRAKVG